MDFGTGATDAAAIPDTRLERRLQRYGWDLAADAYETHWRGPLTPVRDKVLALAALSPGEAVLDVACGTGLVSFPAARAVGPSGRVLGVDLSGRMVGVARTRADVRRVANAAFERMDAAQLALPDGGFDAVLCALGLMYPPEPERALAEMRRVLRPGGRMVAAVWGARERCGWASLWPIVDAELSLPACPLFFRLGEDDALAHACAGTGFAGIASYRMPAFLAWRSAGDAWRAALLAGPVALAWSRLEDEARERVRHRYLDSLAPWRHGPGYRVPGEFVFVTARVP